MPHLCDLSAIGSGAAFRLSALGRAPDPAAETADTGQSVELPTTHSPVSLPSASKRIRPRCECPPSMHTAPCDDRSSQAPQTAAFSCPRAANYYRLVSFASLRPHHCCLQLPAQLSPTHDRSEALEDSIELIALSLVPMLIPFPASHADVDGSSAMS